MSVRVTCQECDFAFRVEERFLGQSVPCPNPECQRLVELVEPHPTPEPLPETARFVGLPGLDAGENHASNSRRFARPVLAAVLAVVLGAVFFLGRITTGLESWESSGKAVNDASPDPAAAGENRHGTDQPRFSVVAAPVQPVNDPEPQVRDDPELQTTALIQLVEPAIVTIRVELGGDSVTLGSGFVCRDNRTVVTNFHVVENGIRAAVTLANGSVIPVLGFESASPEFDLAVLRLELAAIDVRPLSLNATQPERGSDVFAFGAPEGFEGSVSDGIVSALRSKTEFAELLSDDGPDSANFAALSADSQWIQTTAPISSGSSGGPLVDRRGGVVGVNTWSKVSGQNLNFAVAAAHIVESFKNAQEVPRPLAALPQLNQAVGAVVSVSDERRRRLGEFNRALVSVYLERLRLLDEKAQLDAMKLPLEQQLIGAKSRCEGANQSIRNLTVRDQAARNSSALRPKPPVSSFEWQTARGALAQANSDVAILTATLQPIYATEKRLYDQANQLRTQWLRLADPFGLRDRGEYERAILVFDEWVTLDSNFALAYIARALFHCLGMGDTDQALADVARAKSLGQEPVLTLATEAFVIHRAGDGSRARLLFRKARRYGRDAAFVHHLEGMYNSERGEFFRAKADFSRAVSADPKHVTALVRLAELCATCPDEKTRDGHLAAERATAACELTNWKRWQPILALACAHAELGDFEAAVEHAIKAYEVAPKPLRSICQERLDFFLDGKPWRMPEV